MSYYNRRILKKDEINHTKEVVHINDQIIAKEEEYLSKTLKEKRRRLEEELRIEMKKKEEQALKEIEEKVSEIKLKAYNEGKVEAREEIYNTVKEEAEREFQEKFNKEMEAVVLKYYEANRYLIEQKEIVSKKKDDWIKENENQIVDILMTALERMINKTIELEAESVKYILTESLQEVSDRSKSVWIRMNPESKKKIDDEGFKMNNIEIIADPTLDELDILVESEDEWIDSTIKNKLEKMEKMLKKWVDENDILH